jgi:large subunit ribosomal protein L25
MAELKATTRTDIGTRKVRRLRRKGEVPAIIYGHGEPPVPVTLSRHDIILSLHRGDRLLEVDVEGTKQNVLVKEVQYDALGKEVLHMDLTRVDLDELVEVTVPIVLRGTPAGALEDGILQQYIAQVKIECKVRAIPDDVRFSVTRMKVGDQLGMKDLPLPEGSRLLSDPELVVAAVRVITVEEAAPVEEGPAEPEVIGEKKEEEAAEGEAAAPKPEKPAKPEKKEKEKE